MKSILFFEYPGVIINLQNERHIVCLCLLFQLGGGNPRLHFQNELAVESVKFHGIFRAGERGAPSGELNTGQLRNGAGACFAYVEIRECI